MSLDFFETECFVSRSVFYGLSLFQVSSLDDAQVACIDEFGASSRPAFIQSEDEMFFLNQSFDTFTELNDGLLDPRFYIGIPHNKVICLY